MSPEQELEPFQSITEWSSPTTYNLALVSCTVGLATTLSAEKLIGASGSGFLLPYLCTVFLIVMPCTFMELAIGQYSRKNTIRVWDLCPIWRATGYITMIVLFLVQTCHNIISCYILSFTFHSFSTRVEWTSCNNTWAKLNCFTYATIVPRLENCYQQLSKEECEKLDWQTSAEQFWLYGVLNVSSEWRLGLPQGEFVLYSLATCILCSLVTCRGTKSIEKVMIFMVVVPTIQLFLILFMSLIETGSMRGFLYSMMPSFQKLMDFNAWRISLKYSFYSMGLGFGSLIGYGSQSKFRNPLNFKSNFINIINVLMTLCYGLTVYHFMGSLSCNVKIPLQKIINEYESVLFSVVPQALNIMPGALHFWIIMFYSSYLITVIRWMILMTHIQLTVIYDYYPNTLRYSVLLSIIYNLLIFLIGLIFLMPIGFEILNEIENTIQNLVLPLVNLFQLIGIVWFYGIGQFADDVHFMLGIRPAAYVQVLLVLTPIAFATLLILNLIDLYQKPYKHMALFLISNILIWVPIVFLIVSFISYLSKEKSGIQKVMKPLSSWGPVDPILRRSRQMFTAHSMTKEYIYRQNRLKPFDSDDEND